MRLYKIISSPNLAAELAVKHYLLEIGLSQEVPDALVFKFINSVELENDLINYGSDVENVGYGEDHTEVKQPQEAVIDKLSALYVQGKSSSLIQLPNGRYSRLSYEPFCNVSNIIDSQLKAHLKGEITFAAFIDDYTSKFMTFDADCNVNYPARWLTLKLADTLEMEYGISRKDIHISYSGGKGYHTDLFFSEQVPIAELRAFHRSVLDSIGLFPKDGNIASWESATGHTFMAGLELKPTMMHGSKLPLGIQQNTGRRCWFVDNETMEPLEDEDSYEYLLNIEPIPPKVITDCVSIA